MNKSILKYSVSLILISISIYMLCQEQYLSLFKRASFFDLVISLLISVVLVFIGGFNMNYFISRQYKTKLSLADMLTLPSMMNFWGFIIPLRGGMLYSILFLKSKYKILIVQGASMTIFLYTISFTLMGGFGLYYVLTEKLYFSPITLISIGLLFNQLLLRLINHVFQKFQLSNVKFFGKAQSIINKIITGCSIPWRDSKTIFIITIMIITRFFLLALRYDWAARVFDLNISYTAIIMVTFTVEFSNIVFKFLPGNMGLSELIAGSVLGLMGEGTQEGLLIALFIRFTTLLLTFTVGSCAVITNMKYFQVSNIKSLWEKVKYA